MKTTTKRIRGGVEVGYEGKSHPFPIRLTEDEKELLRNAAGMHNMNTGAYIRDLALTFAKKGAHPKDAA